MDFLASYGKEITSLFVPFVTWLLNSGLKAKAKIIYASPHSFVFLVQEPIRDAEGQIVAPTQRISTASIKIRNTGREAANRLEVVFNWKPLYINIWPVRNYESKTDQDNRYYVTFESLAPKDEIGIEIMTLNADLPELLAVRSAECIAQQEKLMWVSYASAIKINIIRCLLALGASTVIYILIVLIQFLVLKTPQ